MYHIHTPPAAEPITLDEMKKYLRVELAEDYEDVMIGVLMRGAREWIERHSHIAIVEQTIIERYHLGGDGQTVALQIGPVQSVTQLRYRLEDMEAFVELTGDHQEYLYLRPAKILLDIDDLPSDAVELEVEYQAGWGTITDDTVDQDKIPGILLAMIYVRTASLHTDRTEAQQQYSALMTSMLRDFKSYYVGTG